MPYTHRDDLLDLCERRFEGDRRLAKGKMMGHTGWKTANNGKFFLFAYEDGLTIKLPPELYEQALKREDMTPFQPMADRKPMGTWLVWVLPEAEEYEKEWNALIGASIDFTMSEEPNPKKGSKKSQ